MANAFRRTIRTFVAMIGIAGLAMVAASAETASPQAFVDGIYKQYLGKNSKGVSLSTDAAIRRYFAPPLANAIIKDFAAAKKRGDVPDLNGDPFIDAQDWEISNLKTAVKSTGDKVAVATVTFVNFKERRTMTLNLLNTAAGWRISEISGPSGSLRGLYKLK